MSTVALKQTEKQFEAAVREYAQLNGWLIFHPFDSRRSEAGYPDLTMVRDGRIVFAELKTDTGRVSKAQRRWLDALKVVEGNLFSVSDREGFDVHVWRPADWWLIERVLGR